MDEGRVHPSQALQGRGLRRDVGHLPGGARGLGLGDQSLVMEGVEEVAEGIRRGERPVQEAGEPGIGLEDADVVEAAAARGEEAEEGFDLRGFAVAALAFADVDVRGDGLVQPERPHRFQDEGQPGPAGHRVGPVDHLHRVRQQALAHRGRRRRAGGRWGGRPPGCVPRRSSRFTAVSALTSAQSSS